MDEQRHTVRPIGIAPLEGVEYNTTTQPNEPPSNVYYYSGTEFKINNVDSAKEVTLWLYSGYDVWDALYDRADYTDGNPPPAPATRKWTCDMFSTQGIIWELNEMLDNVLNGETYPEGTKPDPVGTSTFDYSMSLTTTSETGLPTVITRVSGQGIGVGSEEESWKGSVKDLIAYEYIPDEDDPNLGGDSYIYSYEVQETSIRTGAEADPDSVDVYDEPVTGEDGQRWDGESTLYYARWDETDSDSWVITNQEKDELGVTIYKVDSNNIDEEEFLPLTGAKFKLVKYKLVGNDEPDDEPGSEPDDDSVEEKDLHWGKDTTWGTDVEMEFEEDSEQEGVFNFGKLGFGYYQVVETEFPKGYITTDQKPIFQVRTNPDTHLREAVLVHISGENMGEPIDGNRIENLAKIENVDESAAVTFGNTPGAALPHTGGPGTRLFTILGSILIAGAGLLLWRRRRTI